MRDKAAKLLLDLDRVKTNPLARGIGKSSGLFDALDNLAALVVELTQKVEGLEKEQENFRDWLIGGDNGGQ